MNKISISSEWEGKGREGKEQVLPITISECMIKRKKVFKKEY